MKQEKLTGYRPAYPRKALQSAAMTGLALVAMGGMAGCVKVRLPELQTSGIVPMVTEPPEEVLVTDGEVAIPEPTEEELILDGEVAICEPEETPEPEDIMAPTPDERELTTSGIVAMPEGDGQH